MPELLISVILVLGSIQPSTQSYSYGQILQESIAYSQLVFCSLRQGVGPIDEGTTTCQQVDGTVDKRWDGAFPWSSEAKRQLRDFFGSQDFRLNQRQALNATMSGMDCFVLMPTGGGKLRKISPSEASPDKHWHESSAFSRTVIKQTVSILLLTSFLERQ